RRHTSSKRDWSSDVCSSDLIEYDPSRTARIALLHYADGAKRYILAPNKLRQGAVVENGAGSDIKPGNNMPLRNIPVGTVIHAIEDRKSGVQGTGVRRGSGPC